MGELEVFSSASQWSLYVLLTLIALLAFAVASAQVSGLRGHPFENPDGTTDDWREQKIFYGMAWADLTVACPLSIAGVALTFVAPQVGLVIIAAVSVWLVWANVMTTVTSLRFEKPRITVAWLVVFPFGAVVGVATLLWIALHFEALYA